MRDVAAKAAENVARLAALFHGLEHGASGTIASEEVRAAACIVGWHLNEAQRQLAAAIRLDSWLPSKAQSSGTNSIPTKRIYQSGPTCVRDSRDLRATLGILAERGRAWLEECGRRKIVVINPALLTARE